MSTEKAASGGKLKLNVCMNNFAEMPEKLIFLTRPIISIYSHNYHTAKMSTSPEGVKREVIE
jgi:hypothetical protein